MYRLVLRSGVNPCNDNNVGLFTDEKTAYVVAELLMAMGRMDQPEYVSFDVSEAAIQ
jgi:hypothetical protein